MKQLEIFKENLKFTQWGELYAGIKMNWITTSDVLFFCENQLINNVDEDVYVDLYLSLEESLFLGKIERADSERRRTYHKK